MNFRTTASPAKPMDINSAELPASGAVTGGGGTAKVVPVTITTASITRPRDNFDFCILLFFYCYNFEPHLLNTVTPLTLLSKSLKLIVCQFEIKPHAFKFIVLSYFTIIIYEKIKNILPWQVVMEQCKISRR
jgi:hypothetical protein